MRQEGTTRLRTKAVVNAEHICMFTYSTASHYNVRQIANYQVNNRQAAPTEETRNTFSCLHLKLLG